MDVYAVGDLAPLSMEIHDATGVLASATLVTLTVTAPDATTPVNGLTIAPTTVGVYDYNLAVTQTGWWKVLWVATGTNADTLTQWLYVQAASSMVYVTLSDLVPFATIEPAKAQMMIDDATAQAGLAAPCLVADPPTITGAQVLAAKAVIRAAVLRWNDSGSGAMQSQTAGPFGVTLDTRQQRRGMFWPSEIEQLQDICGGTTSSGAFSVDTYMTTGGIVHADICAINFGATYCSCGAVLTGGYPLYEWGG